MGDRECEEVKARESLIDFTLNAQEAGTLVLVIGRHAGMLVAMFTLSLTTMMNPTDDAVEMATSELKETEGFHKLNLRDQIKSAQVKARNFDKWKRDLSGGTIMQAIISCAAGFKSIKYSDDDDMKDEDPETIKRLEWTVRPGPSGTVHNVMGSAIPVHKEVLQAFTFNPEAFEKNFMHHLDEHIPALHLKQSCNKIVIYDTEGNTNSHSLTHLWW